MTRTFANGRTIVHQRDGLVDVAGPPDVCKTPTPAGPAPVPYVNVARTIDLAQGSRRTRIDGAPIAHAGSNIFMSTGDEPGTAGGGVISSRIRGKLRWQSSSLDVRVEGKGVARFNDAVAHNGNTFNTAFIQAGSTGWAYGDDSTWPCPICLLGPASHRVHETPDSSQLAQQLLVELRQAHSDYVQNQPNVAAALAQAQAEEAQARQAKQNFEASLATPSSSSQADPFADPPGAGSSGDGQSGGQAPLTKEQKKQQKQQLKQLKAQLKQYDDRIKAALAKQRDIGAENNKTAVQKKTGNGGYMIGVMICKCNEIFAAMSGQTIPGFKAVVERQGWTACEETPTVDDYAAANPMIGVVNRWALQRRWNDAQRRNDKGQAFYNPPGKCAASKLVTRKDKHIPKAMTELFFAPTPPHELRLRYRRYQNDGWDPWRVAQLHLSFGRVDPLALEESFPHGVTVPSCLSCQSLVPLTLCLHQWRKCPSGKQPQTPATTSETQPLLQPDPPPAANGAGSSSTS
ncbi:DUF4150 domain-containing protein [Nannocystis sp. RBIL2]|uniref:DUF4150 domain-containing protein n=1 Tax=Nannocystis sp. RBIL2 TaxID=2996788 RepID=UPI00226D793C|nr:DUF4150 domain-containing protein [Nannocystis sp. RBIL2]MCY1071449.1 DUF4150 domain-containing protein [Nannocystis sp. RBIL2]